MRITKQDELDSLLPCLVRKITTDDNHLCLFFADDKYAVYRARPLNEEDCEIEICKESLSDDSLWGLDLISKEEFKRRRDVKNAEYAAESVDRRRREYERLKAEFEGK
jgi:hypothetical protein